MLHYNLSGLKQHTLTGSEVLRIRSPGAPPLCPPLWPRGRWTAELPAHVCAVPGRLLPLRPQRGEAASAAGGLAWTFLCRAHLMVLAHPGHRFGLLSEPKIRDLSYSCRIPSAVLRGLGPLGLYSGGGDHEKAWVPEGGNPRELWETAAHHRLYLKVPFVRTVMPFTKCLAQCPAHYGRSFNGGCYLFVA